jgi:hypothetical protein
MPGADRRRDALLALLTAAAVTTAAPARAQVPEIINASLGPTADFGVGLGMPGDSLMGELGGQFTGVRTFRDRTLLVEWDARLAIVGGVLGNTLPYTGLLGMHAAGTGEVGYRWLADRRFSPYLGVRLGGDLLVTTPPGTAITELDRLNNMDGVGGVNVSGLVRVAFGASLLRPQGALLLTAFAQEALRAPGVYTPGLTLSEGGIAVRFDLKRRLTFEIEGLAGRAPPTSIAALDTRDLTSYAEVAALFRKIFANRMWLGVAARFSRAFDERTYGAGAGGRASATTYSTADAPTLAVHLTYGIPIGKRFNPPRSTP